MASVALQEELLYTNSTVRIGNHEFIRASTPIRYVADGKIEFDSSKPMGRGSRTFVYEGTFENRNVAIKRIPCMDPNQMNEYKEDFKRLEECVLTHVNLVKISGCFLENSNNEVYVPMEICNGNLNEWRNKKIREIQIDFDSFPVHQVLRDIVEGLAFLHSKSIIHGDLKPSNILVSQTDNQITMKLSDFGIISQPFSSKRKEWKAPENLRALYGHSSGIYSVKKRKQRDGIQLSVNSDIFSLGLIFYWILTNKHPFGDDFIDREYNLKEYNIKIDEKYFSKWDLGNLKHIEKMLAENPNDRPAVNKVLHLPVLWPTKKASQFLINVHNALSTKMVEAEEVTTKLESQISLLFSDNWKDKLCPNVKHHLETLPVERKCNWTSVNDLCRVIRNIEEHYQTLPEKVRTALGSQDEMLKCYWLSRFPYLVQILWESCQKLKTPDNKFNLNDFYEM